LSLHELTIVHSPTVEEQVARWATNAPSRLEELASQDDSAYRSLTNLIASRIPKSAGTPQLDILDVGCGLGFLSQTLASLGHNVTAIDPCAKSIEIARSSANSGRTPNFMQLGLGEFVTAYPLKRFDVVVTNMTLHCVDKIPSFMANVAETLRSHAICIVTIPNPSTYLQSRADLDLKAINLAIPQVLEIPFRIHGRDPHPAPVFYFHRPLRFYDKACAANGLQIDEYTVPRQVGAGRPEDIALLVLKPTTQALT